MANTARKSQTTTTFSNLNKNDICTVKEYSLPNA